MSVPNVDNSSVTTANANYRIKRLVIENPPENSSPPSNGSSYKVLMENFKKLRLEIQSYIDNKINGKDVPPHNEIRDAENKFRKKFDEYCNEYDLISSKSIDFDKHILMMEEMENAEDALIELHHIRTGASQSNSDVNSRTAQAAAYRI